MNLGTFQVDDTLTWIVNTHNPATGAASGADAQPTYRVYEENTDTPLLTGTMTSLDAVSGQAPGAYDGSIALTAAAGFEAGKRYTVRIAATVSGISAVTLRTFQVEAAGGGGGATADEIAAAVAARVLETGVTWEQALRGILAQSVGDITNASGVQKIKSTDGAKDRATATIDAEAGTRTVTARDLT